jgi:PelA/Pel-15E family pectate lyase
VFRFAAADADSQSDSPPSLELFADAIHHWQNRHGSAYPRYRADQVEEIADNLLLYQRDHGGWIENRDPARILSEREKRALRNEKAAPTASFDNRNIYAQIEYLSAAYVRTHSQRYREAAERGIEFTLAQQHRICGGWPHTVPPTQPYHSHITIADEVTSGVLRTLRRISEGATPYEYVDAALRERVTAALRRGDDCVLRLQIEQAGGLAGWAGQYDATTLQPAQGRSFELPAIATQESVEMVRYLMSIAQPSDAQVRAIEGAVEWLRRSQLDGMRLETIELEQPVKYPYHTATFDRRLVEDPNAPPLWARFYDLRDNSVVLANRDGVRVARYADVHPERRSGYSWYGDWPNRLLAEGYPAWRERVGR